MKPSSLIFRFLIAVFFSLIIILFDSLSWLGWFRDSIETIFRPETRALSLASDAIAQSIASVRYISSGPARIADLERRLAAAENLSIVSVRNQEKSDSAKVFGWADGRNFSLIPAAVLSSGSQLIIEIPPDLPHLSDTPDLIGQPVISPEGALVGSIALVSRWSARVKLLSDSGSQIPVAVLKPDKQKLTVGLLSGSFGAAITLEKVLTEIDLQPDLSIVTTGEDYRFPSDLLIGWIGKTGAKEVSSLYQTAEVVPAVNPSQLKTVFIIE